MEHDVAGNAHGILKVALDLVQDILGGATEKDGAGLGVLALGEEGEVFVTNLLDLEEAAPGADIRLLNILDPVDNGGASGAGYSVVVGFAYTAERSDVGLQKVVLSEICEGQ